METWPVAIDFVLRQETGGSAVDGYRGGAFHSTPGDPGGPTGYGLAQHYHPDLDVRTLTLEVARNVYLRRYWFAAGCDSLPPTVALALFDCAVNPGIGWATTTLQRLVGAKQDGNIGPKTVAAVQRADGQELVRNLQAARLVRYSQDRDRAANPGWWRRCVELAELVGSLPK